jgi:hypothetical protein
MIWARDHHNVQAEQSLLSYGFFALIWYTIVVAVASAGFGEVWGQDSDNVINIYYFLLLSSIPVLSWSFVQRSPLSKPSWRSFSALLAISALFVLSTIHLMDYQSLWQDEYTQFVRSAFPERRHYIGLVAQAANQQQPPADFFFSNFSKMIFGINPFAIRFHSALFAFGFYISLYLFLVVHTKNRLVSFFVTLYSLSLPSLRYYLIEARPIALCLFASVFNLHFFILRLKDNNKDILRIFLGSSVFLTLTIGFQTEVFLICLGLILILSMICDPKKFESLLGPLKSLLLSALLFAPFLYLLYVYGDDQEQFKDLNSADVIEKILNLKVSLGAGFVTEFNDSAARFSAVLVFILACLIYGLFYKKFFRNKIPLSVGFLGLITYPVLFSTCFGLFINWFHSVRYNMIYVTLFFLFLAAALDFVLQGKFQRTKTVVVLSICLAITIGQARQATSVITNINSFKPAWSDAYRALNKALRSNTDAVVFYLRVLEIGEHGGPYFPLHELYVDKQVSEQLFTTCRRKECEYFFGEALASEFSRTVYLVLDSLKRNQTYHEVLRDQMRVVHSGERIKVYAIEPDQRALFIKNVLQVFDNKQFGEHPLFLSKVLTSYYCHTGDQERSIAWLKKNSANIEEEGFSIE